MAAPAAPGGRGTSRLLRTADVGAANRARVLQALADHGPLSRADLARLADVPRATIGGIVVSLLASGVLVETAPRRPASGAGKPARPLWFGAAVGLTGGVLVRPGLIETAVVSASGEIVSRGVSPFTVSAGRADLDRQLVSAAAEVLRPYRGRLVGTGVAMPASCDGETGEVIACTPVPGLVGTRLPTLLRRATGVPVVLEEDARALAIGQRWFGQARGVDDFVAVQIGAGIGAAIMLDGRLYRAGPATSEIGHTCVDVRGDRCRCGLTGCWETIASLRWLRREAAARRLRGGRTLTPAGLVERSGDPATAELLHAYADHVAVGIANLVQLLSLRVFILHGEVVGGGEPLRLLIEQAVVRRTLPVLAGAVRVEFAALDQDAGLLGAAAAALTRELAIVA